MADWIHCNSCFVQPSPEKKFLLTSCGHVFCSGCAEKCSKTGCYICGTQCNMIPLSAKMKAEVEIYFLEPSEVNKRHSQEFQKVLEFQRGHRKRFLTKTKERMDRAKQLYEEFRKLTDYTKELEKKHKLLCQEHASLRQQVLGGRQQLPVGNQQNMRNTSLSMANNQAARSFASPVGAEFPPVMNSLSKAHNPPSMPARIILRTPPSGGRMGFIPGSNMSSMSSEGYNTPMCMSTPSRSQYQTPNESQGSAFHSQSLPLLQQIRLPGSTRSGGSGGYIKRATVSPFSPQPTPP